MSQHNGGLGLGSALASICLAPRGLVPGLTALGRPDGAADFGRIAASLGLGHRADSGRVFEKFGLSHRADARLIADAFGLGEGADVTAPLAQLATARQGAAASPGTPA